MRAEKLSNHYTSIPDGDEFQAINRLIAMNAIMEAAKMGREGEQFANVTEEMMSLARDAVQNDDVMANMIEKQIAAINNLKQSGRAKNS